jgi:hypothetical protein
MVTNVYTELANRIIKEQESLIGPLALNEARKVSGIIVGSGSQENVEVQGDGKEIVGKLVEQYAKFFGKASIEVCKEAISPILSTLKPGDLPEILST